MRRHAQLHTSAKALALAGAFAVSALAQIPAPGALSSYAGCRHNTCTWVPLDNAQHIFRRGAYKYTVGPANGDFVLMRDGKTLIDTPLAGLSASVSIVWNHDNNHFAVTWSDGGAIGGFHVRVFGIQHNAVQELPAVATAVVRFAQAHSCPARGNNVQAYTWLRETQLVLVLSVYDTGDCGAAMGFTEAYTVDAQTGAVLKRMTQDEFVKFAHSHAE